MMDINGYQFNAAQLKRSLLVRRFCTDQEEKDLIRLVDDGNVSSQCSICLETVYGSYSVTVVHAESTLNHSGEKTLKSHLFHQQCLKLWQMNCHERFKKCPLCTRLVTPQVSFSSVALAVLSGREDCALKLIENGADPDAVHSSGMAALHIAAQNGNLKLALALLERGANINLPDGEGETAVHYAINCDNPDMLSALLAWMPDIDIQNSCGYTPLIEAAGCPDKPDLFHLLLTHGADYNMSDNEGSRAIHHAAISGHESALKALIDMNVDVNVQDDDQCTALHYATNIIYCNQTMAERKDTLELVKILIAAGARVDLRSSVDNTAFDGGSVGRDVIKVLLASAMDVLDDVNQPVCSSGHSMLYYALQAADDEAFRKLIAKGARVDSVCQYDWKVFFRENCEHKQLFVEILKKAGYQQSTADSDQDVLVKIF